MKTITQKLKKYPVKFQVKNSTHTKNEIIVMPDVITESFTRSLLSVLPIASNECIKLIQQIRKDSNVTLSKLQTGILALYPNCHPVFREFDNLYSLTIYSYNYKNKIERAGGIVSKKNTELYNLSLSNNLSFYHWETIWGYPVVDTFFIIPKGYNIEIIDVWQNGILRKEYSFKQK